MAATVSLVRIQDQLDFSGTPGAGTDGYALTWDNATSRFVLTAVAATPAGSSGQVQYNAAGAFGGAAGLAWSTSSPNLTVTAQNAAHVPFVIQLAGSQTANAFQVLPSGSSTPLLRVTSAGQLYANSSNNATPIRCDRSDGHAFFSVSDAGSGNGAVIVGVNAGSVLCSNGSLTVGNANAGGGGSLSVLNGRFSQTAFTRASAILTAEESFFIFGGHTLRFTGSNPTTYAQQRFFRCDRPTITGVNAGQTVTNAATLYVENAPAAGTNVTITNAYALWVDDGLSRFDGAVIPASLADSAAPNGTLYYSTDASKLVFKDSGGVVNNLY